MSEQATETGGIAADRLRSLIERIERLEEEKKAIASDILINTSTAASYLTSNYYSYYWNRS
jgi:uncharacterized protein (UPF0335 family)